MSAPSGASVRASAGASVAGAWTALRVHTKMPSISCTLAVAFSFVEYLNALLAVSSCYK